MLETIVTYQGHLRCQTEHAESGAIILTDAPKDNQGEGDGFSPSELLSISLGSCILTGMGIAARAMEIDITGATASVTKEMANAPRRIVGIGVTIRVPGNYDDRQRAKLEAAAHACPVHHALGIEVPITVDWPG